MTTKEQQKILLSNTIEIIFNNCNLIGDDVDILQQINKYDITKKMNKQQKNILYNYLVDRLGFTTNY